MITPPFRLPLRWTGALPAGDLAPLNCLYGGEGAVGGLPAADLKSLQVPKQAQWPAVRVSASGGAEAGPTGAPWVNANGWLIRMLQFRDPVRQVVLDTKPDAAARTGAAALAVADAMAYGGAWVVTHTNDSWSAVRQALRFFVAHEAWRAWKPVAALTVISDFAGANEDAAGECLNLLARRQVGYALARPGDLGALERAAVWASQAPFQIETYLPWLRDGGTMVVMGGESKTVGKGRVIGRPEAWSDPYAAVSGIHLALTRRSDVLRLWNGGSINSHYVAEAGGARGVVHLINYAGNRASHDVSIWLARPWKKAVLTTFDAQTPLKTSASNGGIEIPLPPLGVYAAIELEA